MGGFIGILLIGLIGGAFAGISGLARAPFFLILMAYIIGAGVSLCLVGLLMRFNQLRPILRWLYPYEGWTGDSLEG